MELQNNDPDTLQLKDELDADWVKLWRKATNKKNTTKKQITFAAIPTSKILQEAHRYSKKTP